MLILETNEGLPHKMSGVEEHTVVTGKLFVEDDLTVIEEIHLLRDCSEPVVTLYILHS